MAKRNYYVDVDLNQNSLLKAKLENLASAPSSPVRGQIYFDTTLNQIGVCTNIVGPVWLYGGGITSVIGSGAIQVSTNSLGVATVSILAATQSVAGTMSAADKTKLDNATSSNTASTIVQRDTNGDFSAHDITANKVTGLAAPVNPSDAANKAYVDAMSYGLDVKGSVRTIATSNVATMSGVGQLINGVNVASGDRVLLTSQTTTSQDGIWVVGSGAWTRALDFAVGLTVANAFMFVEEGTYADTGWVCTNNQGSDVVGTNDLVFVQFSSAGVILAGTGLQKTGNILDVLVDTNTVTTNGSNQLTAGNYLAKIASKTITIGTTEGPVLITHNFNTRNLNVSVMDATTFEKIEVSIIHTSVNTITVEAIGTSRSVLVSIVANIGQAL